MSDRMVKVWNDNKLDFTQEFKGKKVVVPAGEYVEMDWDDAIEFKSEYYPPVFDGTGVQKPESYKMIRIEGKLRDPEATDWVCAACGDKLASEDDLDAHIDRFHLDELEDEEVAQKRKAKQQVKNRLEARKRAS